jgi:hypothetical protein
MNSLGYDALGSLADSALCDLHDGGSGRLRRSGHLRLPTTPQMTSPGINRRIGALLPRREPAMRVLRASGRGKRREPLAWWVPAARLSSSRVDWLAQPICQIWHKVVSAVLHELFQLCFSRWAITRRPKFPLACALFTTLLKDRQQTHVRQAHVSLVTFTRHIRLSNWGDSQCWKLQSF